MKKEELLERIYEVTGGTNLGELITEYEVNSKLPLDLKYKDIYVNDKNEVIVVVYDSNSETQFELILNEGTQLEVYYE